MLRSRWFHWASWFTAGVTAMLLLVSGGPSRGEEETATDPASKAVYAKLDEKIPLVFPNETPLEDVLKFIRSASEGPNDSGIRYAFDEAGMKRAGRTRNSPVVIGSGDEPLKTSLRRMLKPLGLTYTVKKGVLTITDAPKDAKSP